MIYLLLFIEFFKIGLFAIGGGLVTVPFLFDLSETYGWFTTKELIDIAYQGLERTVYLYAQYKKPTDNFIEDLATLWIWSEFSKVILSKLSLKEGINC